MHEDGISMIKSMVRCTGLPAFSVECLHQRILYAVIVTG